MQSKARLSVSVDSELAAAGQAAVRRGDVGSISAWVNGALRRQVEHEHRLRALEEFIADYEAEEGEITDEEMAAASRRAREKAVVVRGRTQQAASS